MGMKLWAGTALLLWLAAPAAQGLKAGELPIELHRGIEALRETLADPAASDEKIHARAQELFAGVPSAKIVVTAGLRGWDREPAPKPLPATVKSLMEAARQRLENAIPTPELVDTYRQAQAMDSSGLIDLDRERRLQNNEMGLYDYRPDSADPGDIRLNNLLPLIAMKVGEAFASATLIHEAAHALDHMRGRLSSEEVVDGEIPAFYSQYLYLKAIDPFGERLAYLVTGLQQELRESYSEATAAALNYAETLDVLAGTGGEREKLRQFILGIGYREGAARRQNAPPSA